MDNIKSQICICGKNYNGKGGIVTNGVTKIWCCSKACADKTISVLY